MKRLIPFMLILTLGACGYKASPEAQRRWQDSFCRETYGQNCTDQNGAQGGAPDHNQPMGDL
ncbi:MAG: hypothetical protein AAF337_10215 [Pseudomonadota bacterium]